MKFVLLVALGLVALAAALPSKDIVDFELDNHEQEQKGNPGRAVEGEYSWTAPNGKEIYVKYRADSNGFQILDDDNAVPEAVEAEDDQEDDQ